MRPPRASGPPAAPSSEDRIGQRSALLVSTLASFLTPLQASSVVVALPTIGRDFGIDPVLVSWVITAFVLSAAIFLVPFGRLADIHGRKRVFARGVEVFTLASFLCSLAPSAGLLITARAIQGIGSTMIFGTGVAILTSVFPPNQRGRVLGINVTAVYLGLSVGPPLGGFLTQQFGWRSIFILAAVLGIAIVVVTRTRLRGEWAEARGETFDAIGAGLYGLALVLIMIGLSRVPAPSGIGLIIAGAATLACFVGWERRTPSPMMAMELFRSNPVFTFSNLAALIHYSATFGSTFLLSLYLQYVKGLGPQSAGLVLLAQPVVMAAGSPFAGRLSDRVEPRTVASVGMALDRYGPRRVRVSGQGHPPPSHRRKSRALGARLCAFLVAQHQCGHGFSGETLVWGGIRHPGNDAARGAHAERRDRGVAASAVRGAPAGHPGTASGVLGRGEERLRDLCRPLRRGYLRLLGQGKGALSPLGKRAPRHPSLSA